MFISCFLELKFFVRQEMSTNGSSTVNFETNKLLAYTKFVRDEQSAFPLSI